MAFPASDEIHLLLIAEEAIDAELLVEYWSLLSPDEMARHERIRTSAERRRFLITRAAIRAALSHCVPEVLPAAWRFSRQVGGRPAIDGPVCETGLEFNISHTRGLIVIAIARDGQLGVDVENVDRIVDVGALARRYFGPEEVSALLDLPKEKQSARFFDLWTLKEAWVKATGEGLARALRHADFGLSDDRVAIRFSNDSKESADRWRFWQLRVEQQYQIAIAHAAVTTPCGSRPSPRSPMKLLVSEMIPMKSMTIRNLPPFRSN